MVDAFLLPICDEISANVVATCPAGEEHEGYARDFQKLSELPTTKVDGTVSSGGLGLPQTAGDSDGD